MLECRVKTYQSCPGIKESENSPSWNRKSLKRDLPRSSKSLQIIDLNWLKLNHLEPSWGLKHVKGCPPAQRKFSCWSTLISCAFNCWSTLKMANRRQDIARHHKGSKDESKVTQDVPHTHWVTQWAPKASKISKTVEVDGQWRANIRTLNLCADSANSSKKISNELKS